MKTLLEYMKTFEDMKEEQQELVKKYHRARTKKSKLRIMQEIQSLEEKLL